MSHPAAETNMALAFLPNVVLIVAYVMIAWEKIPKVVIALLGASIILLSGVISEETAIHHIDFNVITLLVGMMIMVNILEQTGGLHALALVAAKKSRGSGLRLMLIFAVVTAVLSAFLDNVTSVLLIGTVTVSIARQLKISPVPFLICETIASNIGGTATLIGDPPNIMIGSAAKLSFLDFIIHLAPIILIIAPVCFAMLAFMFKKDLVLSFGAKREILKISYEGVIKDKPLLYKTLAVLAAVITAFLFHAQLGIEAGIIALAGASFLMLFESKEEIWEDVEWTTIFFFIGLFIIVGAVQEVGTIGWLANQFLTLTQGDYNLMVMLMLWVSGILSAIIDNIPYTATMIPMVQNLQVIDPKQFADLDPLWWSLALGACLGGNGTLIGATANVLVADMAKRQGHPIYFVQFMKYGCIIMFVSLAISTVYVWLRYLAPLSA